jgi:hypothetical protein
VPVCTISSWGVNFHLDSHRGARDSLARRIAQLHRDRGCRNGASTQHEGEDGEAVVDRHGGWIRA